MHPCAVRSASLEHWSRSLLDVLLLTAVAAAARFRSASSHGVPYVLLPEILDLAIAFQAMDERSELFEVAQ
jgi:hypothetical protein